MIQLAARPQGWGQTSRSLRERIPAADPAQYSNLTDGRDWKNPYLVVHADGVELLGETDHRHYSVDSVAQVLERLPASAWPYGLVVAVGDAGIIGSDNDIPKINENRTRLLELLRKLGVPIGFWPAPA